MLYLLLSIVIYTSALLAIISMFAAALGYFRFKKLPTATAELYCDRALFLHGRKCFAAAIADYSKVLEINPDHPLATRNRDRAFARQQPFKERQEEVPEATATDADPIVQIVEQVAPPEPTATTPQPDSIKRGIMYAKKGRLDDAVAAFNQVIAQNPQSATAYMNRGIVHAREKNPIQALEDFDKAIALNPNSAASYMNRGILHVKASDFDKAIENFSKAIELNADYAVAYKKRGEAYIRSNLFNNGIEDFSRAIRIKPKYAEAYISRGRAFAQRGQHEEAQADFKAAIKIKPDIANTYYERGRHQQNNGEPQQALENYKISCDLGFQTACLEYRNLRAKNIG